MKQLTFRHSKTTRILPVETIIRMM